MTAVEMVSALGREGWYYCSLKGVFMERERIEVDEIVGLGRRRRTRKRGKWKLHHKTGLQAARLGAQPMSPTFEQIRDTHARQCGELVAVDDGAEIPF